ncbi:MAG TPA: MFS transporter [Pyrinomonadaceae bacterium]|nr:MFS transporter [Pyrinomonadaceae bacterium]
MSGAAVIGVGAAEASGRWRALALLGAAELLAMSLWFSASAVVPALRAEWRLTEGEAGWLTTAVQLGFVAGTLLSALLNLPDVLSARKLFTLCAVAGAATNACFGLLAESFAVGVLLRFLVGFFLAGVYPPGMKVMATWFRRGRGTALGVLVGALTLGKAAPYLFNAVGSADWRVNVLAASASAVAGGLVVLLFVGDGPHATAAAKFDIRQVARVFSNRGVRLANFGYFGHMWELYAMWTWAPVMIRASLAERGAPASLAEAAVFLVIGAGAAGCVAAGLWADRAGRTAVTSVAMCVSGACCVLVGFLYGAHPALLLGVAALWGASVVADSAQFSTCVTELGDPRYMGTALTVQTCCGFLLTTASIHLVPVLAEAVGWRYAFAALAPGPLLGTLAMLRLRALPEASKIAGGRK